MIFSRLVFHGLPPLDSPKFHVKNGVENGKFHANFTLLGRSADPVCRHHFRFPETTVKHRNAGDDRKWSRDVQANLAGACQMSFILAEVLAWLPLQQSLAVIFVWQAFGGEQLIEKCW